MITAEVLREYIIAPTLDALAEYDPRLNTPESVDLMMGTAAQESHLGYWLEQEYGDAQGIFQIESLTRRDIERYVSDKPELSAILDQFRTPGLEEMKYNYWLNAGYARIKYWMRPEPIPESLDGRAAYWKQWYNTPEGKGTVDQYLNNYKRFVNHGN